MDFGAHFSGMTAEEPTPERLRVHEESAPCGAALTSSVQLDRLDPQNLRQRRLILPNLADHRLGRVGLKEELNDLSVWALTTPWKSTSSA